MDKDLIKQLDKTISDLKFHRVENQIKKILELFETF